MKRFLISAGIFLGLLVLMEGIMELTKTDKQVYMRYMRTRDVFQYDKENLIFDPVIGYRLKPGLDKSFNNLEFSSTIHTNSLGFRDDEVSLQNPDVLFLGDSYVWGWGVEEQDDVEKQYEKITGKKALNLGVPGYGSIQEMLMLFKWAKVAPPAGKSIVLFFCANDIYDNENTSFGAFPYFKETNGHISLSSPTEEGFNQWQVAVDKWSIKGNMAKNFIMAYYCLNVLKNMQVKDLYQGNQTDSSKINGGKAFMIVAKDLAEFSSKNQCPITLVYVPPAAYYRNGATDKSLDLVSKVCSKLGFRFLDLSKVLEKSDYYPIDQHWKTSGHKKAAVAIAAMN